MTVRHISYPFSVNADDFPGNLLDWMRETAGTTPDMVEIDGSKHELMHVSAHLLPVRSLDSAVRRGYIAVDSLHGGARVPSPRGAVRHT